MTLYKSLTPDNKGPYSEFDFTSYLPRNGKLGKWLPKAENLKLCNEGWHCADESHIVEWLNESIYEVEVRGKKLDGDNKLCARQMRLLRKCDGWNERTARLFACDCAERVLPLYEKKYPNDSRPHQAIETARKFANGEATADELAAARAAAWDAEWAAAWAAARAAARAAAWAAASADAWDAARAAASAAEWDSELKWQNAKLMELLK